MADALTAPLAAGPFGLGCAPLGNLYRAMSDEQAHDLLEAAWAAGVRWFDTSPHYGLGLSERRLGRFLRTKPREDFVVSTKVGRRLVPADSHGALDRDDEGFDVPADFRRIWDYSSDGVMQSLDQSLQRLGLDRIDVALIHDPSQHLEQAAAEAAPTLERLRDEGVISYAGAGTRDVDALATLVERADLDVVMVAGRYTLLDHEAARFLFPMCVAAGVSVLNVGVFNSGILASSQPVDTATFEYTKADAPLLARARAIAAICLRNGTTLPAAALRFARSHPAVAAIAIGAATRNEVRADRELAESSVSADLWRELSHEGLIDESLAAITAGAG